MLGATGKGDIGRHFPDNDEKYLDADSLKLLEEVIKLIEKDGYKVINIDSTVVAQMPKLQNYIDLMRENVAKVCKIDTDCVNIKATTEEKLGFTGEGLGISAHAVVLVD